MELRLDCFPALCYRVNNGGFTSHSFKLLLWLYPLLPSDFAYTCNLDKPYGREITLNPSFLRKAGNAATAILTNAML
jgi:hypothetical protein